MWCDAKGISRESISQGISVVPVIQFKIASVLRFRMSKFSAQLAF